MVATSGSITLVWGGVVVKVVSLYLERDVLSCSGLRHGPWGITKGLPGLRLLGGRPVKPVAMPCGIALVAHIAALVWVSLVLIGDRMKKELDAVAAPNLR